ncbi:hypothetical protein [Lachnobacterium bovis]|uniref:Uncharacterized protein n=1 Tax=Lachnobacterium bovis TaxID=140626 RepID=A0A1H9TJI6_9FIRM|nr:hypothetical protein [Lachnobacterium bovis]SER97268.1 hypothetical protein SAMN02910429_01667 [Lachnobacterium bovis]
MRRIIKKDCSKSKKNIQKSFKVWYYICGVSMVIVSSMVSINLYGGEKRKLSYNIVQMRCRLDYLQGELDSEATIARDLNTLDNRLENHGVGRLEKEYEGNIVGNQSLLEAQGFKNITSDTQILSDIIKIEKEAEVSIDEVKIDCPKMIYYNKEKKIGKICKDVTISVEANRTKFVKFISKLRYSSNSSRIIEVNADTSRGDDEIEAVIRLEYY